MKGKKKNVSDDEIYKNHPELQNNVPRGCVMIIDKETNEPEISIFANRKFFGKSSGDDDDSNLTSDSVKKKEFSHFLVSEKANGESCHIVRLSLLLSFFFY